MSRPIYQPTEREEAKLLVAYLRLRNLAFSAIPNENYKDGGFRGTMNKRIGVSSGFPDYVILANGYLVALELKRCTNGTVSESQKDWLDALNALHGDVVLGYVARGYDEAAAIVEAVLNGKPLPTYQRPVARKWKADDNIF